MKLSVVIIVKNEEEFIHDCLESVKWADEVILLDGGSIDKTLEIAKEYSVRIISQKEKKMDYAAWHNQGIEEAKYDWIFYVDADERVTPLLKEEVLKIKEDDKYTAYAIPRRNFLLGRELRFGGWYPDYQMRLFEKAKLKNWEGGLHEHPIVDGLVGKFNNPLVHLQPEKIEPALEKSIKWSDFESKLLYDSKHPRMSWWRVLRMGLTTIFERGIKNRGFQDGTEGWIETIYQSFHTMIVYMKLWELQMLEKNN